MANIPALIQATSRATNHGNRQLAVRLTIADLVIVDGVSSLHPSLCDLYGLRIFVESDRATTLRAAFDRGAAASPWPNHWRELFLPSADIYMESEPRKRADLLVAGRGM